MTTEESVMRHAAVADRHDVRWMRRGGGGLEGIPNLSRAARVVGERALAPDRTCLQC